MIYVKRMSYSIIHNRDQHDMKANDDQSTDGEVGDEAPFDNVENFTTV